MLTDELKTRFNIQITQIMKEAYTRAEEIINQNREVFDEIVKKLLEEEILIGDELDEICKKFS